MNSINRIIKKQSNEFVEQELHLLKTVEEIKIPESLKQVDNIFESDSDRVVLSKEDGKKLKDKVAEDTQFDSTSEEVDKKVLEDIVKNNQHREIVNSELLRERENLMSINTGKQLYEKRIKDVLVEKELLREIRINNIYYEKFKIDELKAHKYKLYQMNKYGNKKVNGISKSSILNIENNKRKDTLDEIYDDFFEVIDDDY